MPKQFINHGKLETQCLPLRLLCLFLITKEAVQYASVSIGLKCSAQKVNINPFVLIPSTFLHLT